MRTTTLITLGLVMTLSACSMQQTSISEQNRNPLTASRYGDELADGMAKLIIDKDPITEDPSTLSLIQKQIDEGKTIAANAREIQSTGGMGSVISVKVETTGYVLYVSDALYFSSDFTTIPGPSLHVYLTTVVDPRDATFPDETAIDLGLLQAAYGPQQYAVPSQKEEGKLRTFVLYDTRLKLIYGFAQITKTAS